MFRIFHGYTSLKNKFSPWDKHNFFFLLLVKFHKNAISLKLIFSFFNFSWLTQMSFASVSRTPEERENWGFGGFVLVGLFLTWKEIRLAHESQGQTACKGDSMAAGNASSVSGRQGFRFCCPHMGNQRVLLLLFSLSQNNGLISKYVLHFRLWFCRL